MNREDAIKRLKKAQTNDDRELAHVQADLVLTLLLTSLGYADVVEEYEKIGKWYA